MIQLLCYQALLPKALLSSQNLIGLIGLIGPISPISPIFFQGARNYYRRPPPPPIPPGPLGPPPGPPPNPGARCWLFCLSSALIFWATMIISPSFKSPSTTSVDVPSVMPSLTLRSCGVLLGPSTQTMRTCPS